VPDNIKLILKRSALAHAAFEDYDVLYAPIDQIADLLCRDPDEVRARVARERSPV
jgi:hypothetical protein